MFANKVVVITGAAKRVGRATTKHFHSNGARVVVHYHRSADAAHELVAELNAERPDSAMSAGAELGTQAAAKSLIKQTIETFNQLDVLVNNASSFYPTPLAELNEQQVASLFGSNTFAPLYLSQAALPHLKATRGCIVNMVDVHATAALANHVAYGSAKAALHMQTRILARDLAPDVRVNGVAPGAILWPEGEAALTKQQEADILDNIPMQRTGTPEDLAQMVGFLSSDAAGYVTGQIVAVDGGRSLGIR